MKKIGIVGGLAWRSTIDYYSEICRLSERRHSAQGRSGQPPTPEMSIESLDLKKAISYLGVDGDEESWSRFDGYHRQALQRLEASGAELALIASNTPHHRLAAIARGIGIPMISIFDVAAKECARLQASRVLILGTLLTMRSSKLREAFAEYGCEAAGPSDQEARAAIIELIEGLQRGALEADGAAERITRLARTSFDRQFSARPIVCLACTELLFPFPEQKTFAVFEIDGVTYVNTLAAHANAAFDFAVADSN